MHRRRFLRRGEIGHLLHIGRQSRGKLRGQSLTGDLSGFGLLVVHRQDERAVSPRGAVTLVQQRLERLFGRIDLTRNPQRRGIAIG